jgi:integrase
VLNDYFTQKSKKKIRGKVKTITTHTKLSQIDKDKINDYIDARLQASRKITTIKYDLIALGLVLGFAKDKKYISDLPEFPPPDKAETNPRPSFTKEEWHELLKASRERIDTARDVRTRYKREQLHDFMLFSVHTGMRVNEVLSCRYKDCKVETKKNGGKLLQVINVSGKNGIRHPVGLIGSVRAYESLKKRNNGKPEDKLFPHNHRDQLNNLLKETGMKYDDQKRVRNAKSFRSTYIMFRLIWGGDVGVMDIATNCGNSVNVIQKYYAKYITPPDLKERLSDYPE